MKARKVKGEYNEACSFQFWGNSPNIEISIEVNSFDEKLRISWAGVVVDHPGFETGHQTHKSLDGDYRVATNQTPCLDNLYLTNQPTM